MISALKESQLLLNRVFNPLFAISPSMCFSVPSSLQTDFEVLKHLLELASILTLSVTQFFDCFHGACLRLSLKFDTPSNS